MSKRNMTHRTVSRRTFLRAGVTGLGFVALASACAPAAPPAATSAPAAPSKPAAAATSAPAAGAAPSAPTAQQPAANATAAAPAAKPAASGAAPTGKVILMLAEEPPSLDLNAVSNNISRYLMVDNVLEGLITVDQELKLIPSLAASWEQVDPTRTRFKLRQGVKFHNGEPFTSAAVVMAHARLTDPAIKSNVLGFIDTIKEVVPVDDSTVDIVTKGPDPILLRRLTFLQIMAPEALKKDPQSADTRPIGTGPYRLIEWVRGQRVSLTAADEYWGPDKPTIKDVEFTPRKESEVRLAALKAGETHLISNIAPEDAAGLPSDQVATTFATETPCLRTNGKTGITTDARVRLAMSHSIDRAAIIKDILGGYATLPNGQLYNSATIGYDATLKDHEYNVDKARQLVKEAQAEGGVLILAGSSQDRYPKEREFSQAMAAMIEQSGLKVDLRLLESSEWNKVAFEVENPVIQASITSAGNDLLDPDRIFSSYIRTGGRTSTRSIPELDKLIDAERVELDPQKRADILKQIGRMNYEQAMIIPLFGINWIYGVNPKLTFKPMPNGMLPIKYMTLKA